MLPLLNAPENMSSLICHLEADSLCLLAASTVVIGPHDVRLPHCFAAHKGWIFLASIPS